MKKGNFRLTCVAQKRRCLSSLITDWGGGGLGGGGLVRALVQRLNTSFVPPGYFITFELFSLSRPKGLKYDPKKWEKYVYIYIYISK